MKRLGGTKVCGNEKKGKYVGQGLVRGEAG